MSWWTQGGYKPTYGKAHWRKWIGKRARREYDDFLIEEELDDLPDPE